MWKSTGGSGCAAAGLTAVVLVLGTGCAAEDGGSGRGSRTAPIQVAVDGSGKCTELGPQACYCADGMPRGTQTCNTDGSLSPCSCAPSGGGTTGGTGGGGNSAPAMLCQELAGKSGCTAQSYESEELPASILFVIDRSKSMDCNPPPVQDAASCEAMAVAADPNQPSRWDVTVAALKEAFAELHAGNATAQVGLSFFSNDDTCGVSSRPAVGVGPLTDSNLTTLNTILDGTQPNGGTPVIGATILAYQHLHEEAGAAIECPGPDCPCAAPPCGAAGNRYVVLITDSSALTSCAASSDELATQIAQLLDVEAPKAVRANVRTFVVGAPGSEPSRGLLSELAFVGGTAKNGGQCQHDRNSSAGDCHFDMTTTTDFAADLANVLKSISGAALGCQFSVPTTLDDASAGNVNVQFTAGTGGAPECIARDDSTACDAGANGWQFAKLPDGSDDLTKVVLCGNACQRVEDDPGGRVDVLVGCETLVLE